MQTFENIDRAVSSQAIVKFKQQCGYDSGIDNVLLVWPKPYHHLMWWNHSWYYNTPLLVSFEPTGLLIMNLNGDGTKLTGGMRFIDHTQINSLTLRHSFSMGAVLDLRTKNHHVWWGVRTGSRLDSYQYRNFNNLARLVAPYDDKAG